MKLDKVEKCLKSLKILLLGFESWVSSQKVKFQFPVCEIPVTSLLTSQLSVVCLHLLSFGFGKNNAIKLSKVHMKPMRISVQISIIPHAPTIILYFSCQDFWEFERKLNHFLLKNIKDMTSSATQEVHDLLFKTMSLILKFFFAPALITVNRVVIAKTHQKFFKTTLKLL